MVDEWQPGTSGRQDLPGSIERWRYIPRSCVHLHNPIPHFCELFILPTWQTTERAMPSMASATLSLSFISSGYTLAALSNR